MTQIFAAVIAGIFQVIAAMIRRSDKGAKKKRDVSLNVPLPGANGFTQETYSDLTSFVVF